jgi:hypothetical protein
VTDRCAECGFDWALGRPAIVACIAGAPERFLNAVGNPPPSGLGSRVLPGVWSPLEYVAHTGDALGWYGERVRQIVDGSGPLAAGPDWDRLLGAHAAERWSAVDALRFLGEVAEPLGTLLEGLGPGTWQSTGSTPAGGRRSVAELARRAAHEVRHHAFDVQRLLGASLPAGHKTPSQNCDNMTGPPDRDGRSGPSRLRSR